MNANTNDTAKQSKARRPRTKPVRTVRVLEHPCPDDPQGWFAVSISLTSATRRTTRTQTTVYLVREIAADGMGNGCCGFEVEKLDAAMQPTGDQYHVLLGDGQGSCDCKGGEQHGRCKHREGIQALLGAGRLRPFRSGGDMAANDPIAFDQHMRRVTADEYPDEPPQLPHWSDWSPDDDGPDTAA